MEEYNELLHAVMTQALEDWRYLCKGGIPTQDCNFTELDTFFKSGCYGYIDQETAKRIHKKLRQERKAAMRGARAVELRGKGDWTYYAARRGKVVIGCFNEEADAQKALA